MQLVTEHVFYVNMGDHAHRRPCRGRYVFKTVKNLKLHDFLEQSHPKIDLKCAPNELNGGATCPETCISCLFG